MPTKKQHTDDDEWEIAQVAFETARQLPAGAKRFEALNKGRPVTVWSYRKRNNQSGRRPVHPDEEG
jgi:hypothetical protein